MGITSSLLVPMLVAGRVVGGLVVNSRTQRDWSEDDVRLLSLIANTTAQALDRVRLFEAGRESEERYRTLVEYASDGIFLTDAQGRYLTVNPRGCDMLGYSREELLTMSIDDLIAPEVLALLNADGAALAMRDPVSGEPVVELARGAWTQGGGERLPPGAGVSGHVIATGQPYANDDVRTDPRFAPPDPDMLAGVRALACVPLIAQEQTIGAVWVGCKTAVPKESVRVLTAIADMAGNALQRAALHEQTERDAVELTLAYDTTLEGWARSNCVTKRPRAAPSVRLISPCNWRGQWG